MTSKMLPVLVCCLISGAILGIFYLQNSLTEEITKPVFLALGMSTLNYLGAILLLSYGIKKESQKFLLIVLGGMTLRMFFMLILIILAILFLKINQYYFIFTVFILYFLYLAAEIYITVKTDKKIYKF